MPSWVVRGGLSAGNGGRRERARVGAGWEWRGSGRWTISGGRGWSGVEAGEVASPVAVVRP